MHARPFNVQHVRGWVGENFYWICKRGGVGSGAHGAGLVQGGGFGHGPVLGCVVVGWLLVELVLQDAPGAILAVGGADEGEVHEEHFLVAEGAEGVEELVVELVHAGQGLAFHQGIAVGLYGSEGFGGKVLAPFVEEQPLAVLRSELAVLVPALHGVFSGVEGVGSGVVEHLLAGGGGAPVGADVIVVEAHVGGGADGVYELVLPVGLELLENALSDVVPAVLYSQHPFDAVGLPVENIRPELHHVADAWGQALRPGQVLVQRIEAVVGLVENPVPHLVGVFHIDLQVGVELVTKQRGQLNDVVVVSGVGHTDPGVGLFEVAQLDPQLVGHAAFLRPGVIVGVGSLLPVAHGRAVGIAPVHETEGLEGFQFLQPVGFPGLGQVGVFGAGHQHPDVADVVALLRFVNFQGKEATAVLQFELQSAGAFADEGGVAPDVQVAGAVPEHYVQAFGQGCGIGPHGAHYLRGLLSGHLHGQVEGVAVRIEGDLIQHAGVPEVLAATDPGVVVGDPASGVFHDVDEGVLGAPVHRTGQVGTHPQPTGIGQVLRSEEKREKQKGTEEKRSFHWLSIGAVAARFTG